MWTIVIFACGLGLGYVGAYAHMIWRRREALATVIREGSDGDKLKAALQTLRNILQVPKITHAQKLARRELEKHGG